VAERAVTVEVNGVALDGDLTVPDGVSGLVAFAHGSGSSRRSPRNRYVAGVLHEAGLATLLFDLLTPAEEEIDLRTRHLRFDIALLAERLIGATDWLASQPETSEPALGYFGASTGAAAALVAAAERPRAAAVVSRGGRPDLAGDALERVRAPTLLIVGGRDEVVLDLNHQAMARMSAPVELEVVPGATHLFEEPGALEAVARLARDWFLTWGNPGFPHEPPR
jgi:dienelactone hydrolase